MKTNRRNTIALCLLAIFVVTASCTTSKSSRKCDGSKGQRTRMGTM
ncbi:MAG: hypothetical protein ABF264_05785 [Flavobacteriales bacterium]